MTAFDRELAQFELPPQSGAAFILRRGQTMSVVDVEGEQVSDLICFSHQNIKESFSAGRTLDYNGKLFLTMGDRLYSVRSRPMMTITADQVGGHTCLYAPCNQEMFYVVYDKMTEPHPNCLDNLSQHLAQFGIDASQIGTPFNIFMNVTVTDIGTQFGSPIIRLEVKPPRSKARQSIDLRAEMDLIVGLTACSAGRWNNDRCTPVAVRIYAGATSKP